ncbi:hypothetical protein Scep_020996 [Stephania cephalantha]|uniref:Mitochondrial import receptor subunit TOM20 n=1 Tax=Stephania cephalantha TaxID=152367 RepID=A0AAP0F595_9MAGN
MDFAPSDMERQLIFDKILQTAEMNYLKDPLDADNLTRWGGTLVELAQHQNPSNSTKMVEAGISKLEEALVIEPKKHDALWCLGNAMISLAFVSPEYDVAMSYFEKASVYFQRAIDEDPGNELYHRSMEVVAKGPELYNELHRHGPIEQNIRGRSSNEGAKDSKKKKNKKTSDLTYDVFGWIFLAVGIITWIGMAKSQVPPPPPR